MNYADYVNVFYGSEEYIKEKHNTIADKWVYLKGMCGNTHPGATEPFGKMSVCAYSGGYPTGYGSNTPNYGGKITKFTQKKLIKGFSHCHQYGTGAIGIYYNYCLVTPVYDDSQYTLTEIIDEKAFPSYYTATYNNSKIKAEATVFNNIVHHRYILNKPGKIKIDLCNEGLDKSFGENFYTVPELVSIKKLNNNLIIFTIKSYDVDKHFAIWIDNTSKSYLNDNIFTFETNGSCEVKISLSLVSSNNAINEVLNDKNNFDEAQKKAYEKWNNYLSRIEAEFNNDKDKRLFYTLLYQSLIKPCNFSGESFLYKEKEFFADIATMWDIYKTQLPLIFTLYKNESEMLISTFINCYKNLGFLPNTITLNKNLKIENNQAKFLMAHSIADAYYRNIDADYNKLKNLRFPEVDKQSYPPHILDVIEGYNALLTIVNVKKPDISLEDAFDNESGLLKKATYYEGDIYNYSFRLLSDMDKRFEICSKDKYEAYLDEFFGFTENSNAYSDINTIIDGVPATKNMFEGFNNEPDMETPYNYLYLDRKDKLKEILEASYDLFNVDDNSKYPGNCDSGGLSATILWNMLGIFPLSGQDKFAIGVPKITNAKLNLSNGKILELSYRDDKLYINGNRLDDNFISVSELFNT